MKKWQIALIIVGIVIIIIIWGLFKLFVGVGNTMVTKDEAVKAAWSQVENVYQRRFDLIPNLVEIVKGYAKHEKETLEEVTKARAKMGGMVNIDANVIKDPALMQKYRQAQAGLGAALQRLMVVSERYPDLKANQNFRDLQAQLEGTENRVTVERRRYNTTVQGYNTYIRLFPNSIIAGMRNFQAAQHFKMEEAAKEAPKVKF